MYGFFGIGLDANPQKLARCLNEYDSTKDQWTARVQQTEKAVELANCLGREIRSPGQLIWMYQQHMRHSI